MRRLAGALVALAVGALGGCGAAGDGGTERPGEPVSAGADAAPPGAYAAELTDEANQARITEGLDALPHSDCLAGAAAGRAEELVGGPLEHRPLPDVARRCTDTGRVAENLVRSAVTPAEVVAAWMDSTGHRNNLVDPAMREVGTGCRPDGEELLCVQLYLQAE